MNCKRLMLHLLNILQQLIRVKNNIMMRYKMIPIYYAIDMSCLSRDIINNYFHSISFV